MNKKEKEVMLSFLKEQQRYIEKLTAFCNALCDVDISEDSEHHP